MEEILKDPGNGLGFQCGFDFCKVVEYISATHATRSDSMKESVRRREFPLSRSPRRHVSGISCRLSET